MRAHRFTVAALAALAALTLATRGAAAQTAAQTLSDSADTSAQARDSLFARAERLVREGQGPAGRALVDSALHAATPGSPTYVDALYWHARLAASAADAERGYRQLAVEYPLAPHADDALLNLAQLQLARGDRAQAIRHLERLNREHPTSPARGRGTVLLARLYFDSGDTTRACAALADADRILPPTAVELRNQVEYFGARCVGSGERGVGSGRDETPPPAKPQPQPKPQPKPQPTSEPRAERSHSPLPTPHSPRPAPNAPPRYTIQLAAYNTRPEAEHLVKQLKARGFAARVVGETKPFRVRLGVYATREAAVAAAKRVREKKMEAIVVPEPERER